MWVLALSARWLPEGDDLLAAAVQNGLGADVAAFPPGPILSQTRGDGGRGERLGCRGRDVASSGRLTWPGRRGRGGGGAGPGLSAAGRGISPR
ncbi:unnamed protein product [Rangifer tarandus platyrhynchus]|uniref:Uncharacterized protein n=2 Tax=Rangifer tarandus platyrhynchus TaxID=3082113 RepID=A0ABN8ZD03_RANTA|nr:unnamed protein product [Rangifer tarandus platyrhynchus]CAI9707802.1 unnamed protein product [Rangifer tarandus platyrhynchus]